MSDSDDDLQLSAATMAALQQFMAEQQERKTEQEKGTDFEEDWQLSQFWVSINLLKDENNTNSYISNNFSL